MADNFISGIEETPLPAPIQAKSGPSCVCCSCTYRVPTLRELYARDKRLLRAILLIVILLNAPIGRYILYPFAIFSTWIHESFHGLAGEASLQVQNINIEASLYNIDLLATISIHISKSIHIPIYAPSLVNRWQNFLAQHIS